MKTLITSWIVLWASYLSLAALSPRDKAVTRPRANVTDLKVINNLVKNHKERSGKECQIILWQMD